MNFEELKKELKDLSDSSAPTRVVGEEEYLKILLNATGEVSRLVGELVDQLGDGPIAATMSLVYGVSEIQGKIISYLLAKKANRDIQVSD